MWSGFLNHNTRRAAALTANDTVLWQSAEGDIAVIDSAED